MWYKNAEGYTDMTAALAIRAAERDEMDIEAWDIVRYESARGYEVRLAVIGVKNGIITGAMLSAEPSDGAVKVIDISGEMYAQVERLMNINPYRVDVFLEKHMSDDEVDALRAAVVRYVGAEPPERLTVEEGHTDTVKEPERGTDDLKALAEVLTLRAERDVYKRLYDDLLKRIAGA